MEAPYPDDQSEDAKEGEAAHWLAAQVLGGHHELEELTDRAAPNGVIITGEMVKHTETYIDAVRSVTTTPVIERVCEPQHAVPGTEPGTPDAQCVTDKRHGHIWDFKYGYGIVEAIENKQLACYIVQMMTKHEWSLEVVTAYVCQPRPYHIDGRVRSWTLTRDEAIAWYHRLTEAAQQTQNPNAQCVTGAHCKYCSALHACEAARRAALNAVDVSHAAMLNELRGHDLAGEIKMLRRASDAIKLRMDAIEAHTMSVIDGGEIVPGFEIDRALGNTRWQNPDQIPFIEAITGIKLTETKPISPTAAKRAGVSDEIVSMYSTRLETGRKLVERANGTKAKEVFK